MTNFNSPSPSLFRSIAPFFVGTIALLFVGRGLGNTASFMGNFAGNAFDTSISTLTMYGIVAFFTVIGIVMGMIASILFSLMLYVLPKEDAFQIRAFGQVFFIRRGEDFAEDVDSMIPLCGDDMSRASSFKRRIKKVRSNDDVPRAVQSPKKGSAGMDLSPMAPSPTSAAKRTQTTSTCTPPEFFLGGNKSENKVDDKTPLPSTSRSPQFVFGNDKHNASEPKSPLRVNLMENRPTKVSFNPSIKTPRSSGSMKRRGASPGRTPAPPNFFNRTSPAGTASPNKLFD